MYDKFFIPFPKLETERLILRRMEKRDAADLFACFSDPGASRYSIWSPHRNLAYTKNYVRYMMRSYRAREAMVFCIVLKEENRVIGTCSFTEMDTAYKVAEIGYTLSPAYWHCGYGSEAVKALLKFGFETIGLLRVSARVMPENRASSKLLQRLGFKQEGYLSGGIYCKGRPHDVCLYGLLREEKQMEKIKSFQVNHNTLKKGLYVSRVDRDVVTYDLRMKLPNGDDYLDCDALHTIEHLFATYARNSAYTDKIIYVGPMGCRTGFYFLVSDMSHSEVLSLLRDTFRFIADFSGEIPGTRPEECGNYLAHNLPLAKKEAAAYLAVLENCSENTMNYTM